MNNKVGISFVRVIIVAFILCFLATSGYSHVSATTRNLSDNSNSPKDVEKTSSMGKSELMAVGPIVFSNRFVDDDNINNSMGNNDELINPGETIELYIDLVNNGSQTAVGVSSCLTEDSPFVTLTFNDCSDYGDIPGSGEATNINDFDFVVDPDTPDGYIIHFTITTTATNGGPWEDHFSISVKKNHIGVVFDSALMPKLPSKLLGAGYSVTTLENNFDGAQGIYTSDINTLSTFDAIIWYASGLGAGRLITQNEYDALDLYMQYRGRVLVTGYDTLGSPIDNLMADLVRSSSAGDGPFTYSYTVINGDHLIMNGPYGVFPTGTTLTAGHADHDQAEADLSRGGMTIAELAGGRDKIIATELLEEGRVVYWNGNHNLKDWFGTTTLSSMVLSESKDASPSITNERLLAQAERIDPGEVPLEANSNGKSSGLSLNRDTLFDLQSSTVPLSASVTTFIATGDTVSVTSDPYWWHTGDYAEGVRTLSINSVERIDYSLVIGENFLNGSGHVDLNLSINGILVGSFTVLPGQLAKNLSFEFPAISGPTYTIRLEEANTVSPGAGSITLPLDVSSMVFIADQPDILMNTVSWLSQGAGVTNDPNEPNDTQASCTNIFFDIPITTPTIFPAGDWDYYCFVGSANQTIASYVDAWDSGSPLDAVLTLFDSDGTTQLISNNNHNGLDPYLAYKLPSDGTYLLRVSSFGDPCCGGLDYFYSITLTTLPQTYLPIALND